MLPFVCLRTDSQFLASIPAAPLKVLIVLMAHADEQGRCNPSQDTIAKLLGVSQQAVRKSIDALVTLGYLAQQTTHLGGVRARSTYRLTSLAVRPPQAVTTTPAKHSRTVRAGHLTMTTAAAPAVDHEALAEAHLARAEAKVARRKQSVSRDTG